MNWISLPTPPKYAPKLWACEVAYGVLVVNSEGDMVVIPDATIKQDQKTGDLVVVPIAVGAA